MSKKVYILAFQRALNYGALLQLYALKTIISRNGFKVEIIDYVPKWMDITLKNQPSIMSYFKRKIMLYYFQPFFKKLGLSNKKMRSIEDLRNKVNDGDFYIVGSDQVWNEKLIQQDSVYFLSFVSKSKTKIGYSISMGDYPFSDKFKKEILPYLNEFEHISAREKFVVDFVHRTAKKDFNVPVVLDPTLLLDEDDYSILASPKKYKKDFIAVYPCMYDKKLYDLALYLKEKTGLPLVNLGFHFAGADKNEYIYGPENWLNRITNSKYFITNSFHGTAISILHKTQFMVVPNLKVGQSELNSRFTELLDSFNISERLVTNENEIDLIMDKKINFENAFCALDKRRKDSITFLKNALSSSGVEIDDKRN